MGSTSESMTEDFVDVRTAAALVGRHPETIRRWVWSGRLAARREGNRLLVASADLEPMMPTHHAAALSLGEWADRARAAREASGDRGAGRSSAALVIEDRERDSRPPSGRAGR